MSLYVKCPGEHKVWTHQHLVLGVAGIAGTCDNCCPICGGHGDTFIPLGDERVTKVFDEAVERGWPYVLEIADGDGCWDERRWEAEARKAMAKALRAALGRE